MCKSSYYFKANSEIRCIVRSFAKVTYKNIILYSLKITRWNKDEDTSDLPMGQINTKTIIESNLDSFSENKINTTILINPVTKINGNIIFEPI